MRAPRLGRPARWWLGAGLFALAACGTTSSGDGTGVGSGGGGNRAGTTPHGGNGGALTNSGGTSPSTGGGGAGGNAGGVNIGGGANAGSAGVAAGGETVHAGAAGSTTSGGGTGGTGCGAGGLLFCEDFEQLAAGPVQNRGPWTTAYVGPDAPSILVDATTPAHSGLHSVVVHAPVTNFQSFLIYHDATVLPRAQGDFYLRSYVRLGRAMAPDHNTYIVLDRLAAPGAGAAVRLGEQAQMLSLTAGGDAHGSLSNGKFSQDGMLGAHLVANTWACLEGYFNATKPELDFWLDGVEITDFHHTDWPVDNYDTLRFGFEKYAGPELDIWFDDIAISGARIGCQ